MKISFETLNTAAYAIRKRLQGYTLLKNPNGSNPHEVNMIKSSFQLNEHCDDIYSYTRIQRKRINGKTVKIKKELTSIYLMDSETKEVTTKKSMGYLKFINGHYLFGTGKDDISLEEQINRPIPEWNEPKNFFDSNEHDERLQYWKKRYEKEIMKNFYQPHISLLDNIITLGQAKHFQALDNRPVAPGFFKTLIENLQSSKK